MFLRNSLLIILFLSVFLPVRGQVGYPPLPEIMTQRRADGRYLDSLARLAKTRYHTLIALPRTARTDTLRFKALYYLGRLYRLWQGRRDSTLYFGNELVNQARQSQNIFYEVNGKLAMAEYYRTGELNPPLALRLNLQILALLPPNKEYFDVARHRVYVNLASLYTLARNFDSALWYLEQAKKLLIHDLRYAGPATSNTFRVEIEQCTGSIYNQQNNFRESERHYLAAEALLQTFSSLADKAYVYDDLAELYLKYNRFSQALPYAKKAEAIWDQIRPKSESKGWGTLACIYAGLRQDELAQQYAQNVLQQARPSKFSLEQAYMAFYQVVDRKQDWEKSASYFKKYIEIRDTVAHDQRSMELAAIQKQADFDNIVRENQQTRQLQAERLLTVEKQAELNQLRAKVQTESLIKKAQLSEQQRRFDNERANVRLNKQQIAQQMQQQAFEQEVLQQKNQTQKRLIYYLFSSLLLLLGIVMLLCPQPHAARLCPPGPAGRPGTVHSEPTPAAHALFVHRGRAATFATRRNGTEPVPDCLGGCAEYP